MLDIFSTSDMQQQNELGTAYRAIPLWEHHIPHLRNFLEQTARVVCLALYFPNKSDGNPGGGGVEGLPGLAEPAG